MKNTSLFRATLLLCSIIFCSHAHAISHSEIYKQQQSQITGTVTVDGMRMTGVTIAVAGKPITTVSGENGQYTISADPSDTLIFSYVGFTTIAEPVNGRTIINIGLKEDATTLQEVTVNAGYYSVKEKERTGSIAKIKAADIERQPVTNPLAAMQGRMSGVNITQETGMPGGGFNIQVRGQNSIRPEGNNPFYVIDGVPYASQSLGNDILSGGTFPGNISPLNSLNPADIESIEVLKDADATAIYGSRGANGVVLITTKKGKAGATRFNFQAYTSVGTVTRKIDLMNTEQYLSMRAEAFANDGITEYPSYAYDINGTWDQSLDVDWQDELIGGTAYINNMQASISGGSASTQFLISGTFRKETSVFPGDSHYGKGAVHSSITHKSANEKFNIIFSANYSGDKNTLPASDLTGAAYRLAPNAPPLFDENGELNWEDGTFENPLAFLNGSYLVNTNSMTSNAMLSYKVLPSLEFKTSLGFNDLHVVEKRTSPSSIYNPAYEVGPDVSSLSINNSTLRSWIIEPQINWSKQWSGLQVNVLGGATFQNQQTQALAQTGTGFAGNALINNIAAARSIEIRTNDAGLYKYNAVFGRLNLNWKDRYIINLTGRRDGSSRFGPGKRFANFGAIGAAWLFSNETFLKESGILSFGKLRASFGTSGNDQIGDYQYLDTYQLSGNQYNGVIGIQPAHLYNPDFGWETNKKLEAAVELGLWQDKIFLSGAWFRNRSSNQLVGIPLPGTTGFSSLLANLDATVENTGIEIEFRSVNFKKKDFSWTTTLNLTAPKNELLSFPNLEGSTYANQLVIGESLNIRKAYHYTGIDPATGTYTFEDMNGDGLITAAEDRTVIIDTAPKLYGGLGNSFSYKNWNLDFLFQFVKQDGYNYLFTAALAGVLSNQPVSALNHFPQDGTGAEIQQYSTGENYEVYEAYSRYSQSDAAISDASFIRLKSAGLTYSIPSTWSKTVNAKIYLQGQNLLTFTNYKGADPENRSASFLPPLKQFTMGVLLNF